MITAFTAILLATTAQAATLTRATPGRPSAEASVEPFATAEPDVVLRGQTVKLVVKGKDLASLKTLKVEPAGGVTIQSITPLPARADGSAAVSMELNIEAAADPGERTLMLTATPQIMSSGTGRPGNDSVSKAMDALMASVTRDHTAAVEGGVLYINSHDIAITGVVVGKGRAREVRVTVADAGDDVEPVTPTGAMTATATGGIFVVNSSGLIISEARCSHDIVDGILDDAKVAQTNRGSALIVAGLSTMALEGMGACTLRVRVHDRAGNTTPWFVTKLDLR